VIEASKASELNSQPTKRRRKAWLIALAVVVAVVTIALLAILPKKKPVKVWFVRATNELGEKKLVFEGTNGIPRSIEFRACVVTGVTVYAQAPAVPYPNYDWTTDYPGAGTNFYFTLKAPPKDVPYFVECGFRDVGIASTRWGRFRWRCYDFLFTHGMRRLAERFDSRHELQYIPSTEIKE